VKTQYVLGLGIYSSSLTQPPPYYVLSEGKNINYYYKNGVSCGSEMVVGIDEYSVTEHKLIVNPNPASSFVNITSPFELKNITIFNLEGRKIFSKNISGTTEIIDVKDLSEGIYFAKIQFLDNTIATKKIVIIKD
jgi:hypothetical protein